MINYEKVFINDCNFLGRGLCAWSGIDVNEQIWRQLVAYAKGRRCGAVSEL